MNGNAIAYPSASVLRAALAAAGLTTLGFFRLLGGVVPLILLEKRLRGMISQLWSSSELAIASALAAASPAQQLPVSWSDGGESRTSQPPFNIFPIVIPPLVAASSLTLESTGDGWKSFVQSTPLASWTIVHNLGRDPSVTVFDQNDKPIPGTVTYLSTNEITIAFSMPTAGFAYIS